MSAQRQRADQQRGTHGDAEIVRVVIADDGVGLTHEPSGLGSSIVRTLVENELGGQITWSGTDKGSVVELSAHVADAR